jgi:hypothetical protein
MAASGVPPQLKAVMPFLQRAEELERQGHENLRIIAHYCRSYAVCAADMSPSLGCRARLPRCVFSRLRGCSACSAPRICHCTRMGSTAHRSRAFCDAFVAFSRISWCWAWQVELGIPILSSSGNNPDVSAFLAALMAALEESAKVLPLPPSDQAKVDGTSAGVCGLLAPSSPSPRCRPRCSCS